MGCSKFNFNSMRFTIEGGREREVGAGAAAEEPLLAVEEREQGYQKRARAAVEDTTRSQRPLAVS